MSVSYFMPVYQIVVKTFSSKCQPHGGTREKVRGSTESSWDYEILHQIS